MQDTRAFDTSCTRFISNLQQSIPRLFDTSFTRFISNLQQSIPRLLKQLKLKQLCPPKRSHTCNQLKLKQLCLFFTQSLGRVQLQKINKMTI